MAEQFSENQEQAMGTDAGATEQSNQATVEPVDNRALMGILSYIGPLVIVSYLVAKDDPFVKFHIKQGLVLFVIGIVIWILGMSIIPLWALIQILNLGVVVLAIINIVNVAKKQEKPLPLVGQFSRYFNI